MTSTKFLGALIVLVSLVLPLPAATPREELLRLVPDDVGFCLVVQDLRGHWSALAESPFFVQLKASPIGKAIASSPELTQLAEAEKFLAAFLGLTWKQLREDILGDAIIFAYRPGPPGKPDQEQGLVLLHARSAATLASLLDRVNKAQLKSGELKKLEEREHHGIKYLCRVERDQPPTYYCLQGSLLIGSPQEDMLRTVLALDRDRGPADMETPPLARKLRQLGTDKAFVTLWLNPRAFDAELAQKITTVASEAEAVFLKTFQGYWKALEEVALSLTQHKDLELNLAIRLRVEELSTAARKFLAEAAQPSELWHAFPPDAMLAAAGRFDVAAFLDLASEFLDEKSRKALQDSIRQSAGPAVGKTLRDLLPSLGPDVGLCVVGPATKDQGLAPQAFWALRVRPHPTGKPTGQTLMDVLNFFAGLAVLEYNSKHEDRLHLRTLLEDQGEVKYFVNDKLFPAGFQPAFAVKDGYLLLASSPEVIRRFQVRLAEPAPAEVPLVRLSCTTLRNYLHERRDKLAAVIAEKKEMTPAEAAKRLERLLAVLQFFDTVELTQRPTAGQVILTLRVKPTSPLRK